jgi:hypothetical protein
MGSGNIKFNFTCRRALVHRLNGHIKEGPERDLTGHKEGPWKRESYLHFPPPSPLGKCVQGQHRGNLERDGGGGGEDIGHTKKEETPRHDTYWIFFILYDDQLETGICGSHILYTVPAVLIGADQLSPANSVKLTFRNFVRVNYLVFLPTFDGQLGKNQQT